MTAFVLDAVFGWTVLDRLPGEVAVINPAGGAILFTRAWSHGRGA